MTCFCIYLFWFFIYHFPKLILCVYSYPGEWEMTLWQPVRSAVDKCEWEISFFIRMQRSWHQMTVMKFLIEFWKWLCIFIFTYFITYYVESCSSTFATRTRKLKLNISLQLFTYWFDNTIIWHASMKAAKLGKFLSVLSVKYVYFNMLFILLIFVSLSKL